MRELLIKLIFAAAVILLISSVFIFVKPENHQKRMEKKARKDAKIDDFLATVATSLCLGLNRPIEKCNDFDYHLGLLRYSICTKEKGILIFIYCNRFTHKACIEFLDGEKITKIKMYYNGYRRDFRIMSFIIAEEMEEIKDND